MTNNIKHHNRTKRLALATAVQGAVAATLLSPAVLVQAAMIEEVVVTAQKREQNLQDVGIAVTAFSGDTIKEMGFSNSTDVAAQTPGLNIGTPVGEGNNPSIVLRGVGLNDFNDNNEGPIAVYKDEVYVSLMAGQTFQLFDIDRVEVLRGPQGTLYGRNATGGLVHFITNKPTEEFDAYVDLTIAENSQIKFEGAVGGSLSDTARGRLSIATNRHDGYVKNRIGPDGNQADSLAIRGQLELDVHENGKLSFVASYGDTDTLSPKYQHQTVRGGVNVSGPDDFGYEDTDGDVFAGEYDTDGILSIESVGLDTKVDWDFDDVSLTSITSYLELDKQHIEDTDMGRYESQVFEARSDAHQFSQELRFSGEGEKHKWVAGAFYFESTVNGGINLDVQHLGSLLNFLDDPDIFGGALSAENNGGDPFTDSDRYSALDMNVEYQQNTESAAIFGQLEYGLAETVGLTVGLRYTTEERDLEYFNEMPAGSAINDALLSFGFTEYFDFNAASAGELAKIDVENISGKVGLDWRPNDDWLLFASYSQGFKSGGFNAGLLDASDGLVAADIPYDEEILTSYEMGIKSEWMEGRLRFNATAFYYDYQDYQGLSFSGLSQYIRNSDATLKGGELELVVAPVNGLEISLGASFLDSNVDSLFDNNQGKELTDLEFVLAPESSFNGAIRYEFAALGGQLSAQADFNHQGSHYFDITNIDFSKEDPYTVWNARLAYKTKNEKWEIAGWVKNLTNEEYRVYSFNFESISSYNQEFYAPPRWYGLTATYRY